MTNHNQQPISLMKMTVLSIMLACTYFFGALMYTPSLPAITAYFEAGSSLARITISSFLLVLAVSQLFYGPISDKYGRKPVVIFGALIFLIGSVICSVSPTIYSLILGRGVQGLGAGALLILARTIIQDSVSKEKFLMIIAWMSIFFAMAPALSPLLGGALQHGFGWHGNFIFMAIFAAILVITVIFQMPETIDDKNEHALHIKHLIVNYSEIIRNKLFLVYMIAIIVSLGGSVIFDAIGSFVLINRYGFSAFEFGVISTTLLGLIVISRFICSFLLMRFMKTDVIIVLGLALMFVSSLVLLALVVTMSVSFSVFIIIMAIFYLGGGFVLPTSGASALNLFSKNKGSASALYGALQMGGVFLMSFIAALVQPTLMHMMVILFVSSFVSFVVGFKYLMPKSTAAINPVVATEV
ncbi:multidrug effflux MFS transporter [Thiotrichales bacterium 19S3-7]|nr:multidrug effflux MFS transporter [Thiotrichales bacterium 19S3-7]MCF6800788.1 multidrug effflux MFS transporter [Thiotrichales bacterium 19S3-11]